jgi:tetratricopeptide (TPR) repeat protein
MAELEGTWTRSGDEIEEAERLRHQARGLMKAEKLEEAVPLLRRAILLDPMSINFELLGECLLALGQVKEAIIHLGAATGLGHNQFKSRVKLASALYDMGERFTHDAVWQLDEALRVNPRYGAARELLVRWLNADLSLCKHVRQEILDLYRLSGGIEQGRAADDGERS